MSERPPTPPQSPPQSPTPTQSPPVDYGRERVGAPVAPTYGQYALYAGIGAVVFFCLSGPVLKWAAGGFSENPYGPLFWNGGLAANQPIRYLDMPAGTFWRDAACGVTFVALTAEAVVYLVMAVVRPRSAVGSWTIFAVAACGVAFNVLAAVMQVRAGFYQPLYAAVGAILCGISAAQAFRRHRVGF